MIKGALLWAHWTEREMVSITQIPKSDKKRHGRGFENTPRALILRQKCSGSFELSTCSLVFAESLRSHALGKPAENNTLSLVPIFHFPHFCHFNWPRFAWMAVARGRALGARIFILFTRTCQTQNVNAVKRYFYWLACLQGGAAVAAVHFLCTEWEWVPGKPLCREFLISSTEETARGWFLSCATCTHQYFILLKVSAAWMQLSGGCNLFFLA